jgi:hypothetical protein
MKIALAFIFILLLLPIVSADALISVPATGLYDGQEAYALIYTNENAASATLSGTVNTTIALTRPRDTRGQTTNCQGNLNCWYVNLTGLPQGQYQLTYNTTVSKPFTIAKDVYAKNIPVFEEFFSAHLMQGSRYHATYFGVQQPAFTAMADGAVLMHADQAAITLTRMSLAYQSNPTAMQADNYVIRTANTSDYMEHIVVYLDILRSFQRESPDGYKVIRGWGTSWGDWNSNTPNTTWYATQSAPWLVLDRSIEPQYTAKTLLAYTSTVPVLATKNMSAAQELLIHTIATEANTRTLAYNEDDKGYLGAALFQLYDLTGNSSYIVRAYGLRMQVEQQLISDHARGAEFYWDEYVRHEQQIRAFAVFEIGTKDPWEILKGKLYYDLKDRGELSMDRTGERVYMFDPNIQFGNSRYQLLEAVVALKTAKRTGNAEFTSIGTSQISWLTGRNAVQLASAGNNLRSVSFINGIGANTTQIHSRLVTPSAMGTVPFSNDKLYIPGWINGGFDSGGDSDIIYNFVDNSYSSYMYVESSNEVVSTALEAFAMADAVLNNKPALQRQIIINQSTPLPGKQPDVAINVGGPQFVTENSIIYSADTFFTGGSVYGAGNQIAGTTEDNIYQSERYGIFSYRIPVQNGTYNLTLHFAEIYFATPGSRVFNITAENKTVVDNLDIVAVAGSNTAYTHTVTLNVTDGFLDLSSISIVENPKLSAISATKIADIQTTPPPSQTCSTLANITSSCVGGTMVVDQLSGGCRTLICDATDKRLAVLACEKPDGKAQRFEMYKQLESGTGLKICLGTTCISDNGFAVQNYCALPNATLRIVTQIINDNGGSLQNLQVKINGAIATAEQSLVSGSHTISASAQGYTITSDCGTSVTLNPSENKTCTIVANDIQVIPSSCTTSLAAIPATCTGGTIIQDDAGGCRTIVCTSTSGDLRVLACDKGTHFEMYQQQRTAPLTVCLGETCISNNGFAKSPDFPICQSAPAANGTLFVTSNIPAEVLIDGTYIGLTPLTKSLQQGTYTVTFKAIDKQQVQQSVFIISGQTKSVDATLIDIPACSQRIEDYTPVCTGGTITRDESGGCRTVVCSGASGSLQVLACNKEGGFEVYRQEASSDLKICFGLTCISDNGFAKNSC